MNFEIRFFRQYSTRQAQWGPNLHQCRLVEELLHAMQREAPSMGPSPARSCKNRPLVPQLRRWHVFGVLQEA